MGKKSEKKLFFIYIFGFVAMALTLLLFQPIENTPPIYTNPPDEHARYMIPSYICEHGEIPTGLEPEIQIEGYGFSYGLYNTFPYIIQGYFMRLVKVFTDSETVLLHAARLVNLGFGIGMAIVVYCIAGMLFKDKRFKWLFCFGVMYLPQSLFLHTYINTDSCCLFSTALMVYALLKAYKEGFCRKNCILMSLGIILCALSYYNAYGYILCCILLFVAFFFTKKEKKLSFDWKSMLIKGSFISVLVLLGIGWWFIRQYQVLDGDFLGLSTRQQMEEEYVANATGIVRLPSYKEQGYSFFEMLEGTDFFFVLFKSFVAAFGSMSMYSTPLLYWGYLILFLTAIGGLILSVGKIRKMKGKELFFHINMWMCILIPFVLTLYYSYATDYQPQGRYLMPMLIPFFYYIVRGLQNLTELLERKCKLNNKIIHLAVGLCFLLIIGGTAEMIFHRCLPLYLK